MQVTMADHLQGCALRTLSRWVAECSENLPSLLLSQRWCWKEALQIPAGGRAHVRRRPSRTPFSQLEALQTQRKATWNLSTKDVHYWVSWRAGPWLFFPASCSTLPLAENNKVRLVPLFDAYPKLQTASPDYYYIACEWGYDLAQSYPP